MRLRLLKLAALTLAGESGKKTLGWILTAVFSPLILIIVFLCALGSGEADRNTNMV